MNTVGERIKAERIAQGIDRKQLAKRTGIGYSTIAELERGGMKTSTQLRLFAEALHVNLVWLETGKGPKVGQSDSEWGDILGYAQAAGLGNGSEGQEYAETHKLKFRSDSLAKKRLNPDKLSVFYGKGDSMEPRIKSGDAILFDMSDTNPRDGAVFIVMIGKEYYAKRCMVLDEAVYFTTDNPNGDHTWRKPRRMDAKREPITIIGRVRWIGSWED
jgi:phage repressor protein C with HTH and peptisase S24 domain